MWKVEQIATGRIFAMKEMSKAIVVTKRSIESILNEREFLATLRHKFIVNMVFAFQDEDNLYIVMNIMEGGDLRYHLSKMTTFTEGETKFMVASILLALEYLHNKMIIHRDVKPENIVFDKQGFAYLTDLGIAKHLRSNNSEDTSGTPGYMAPEVMFHHNHRYEVDYYALGVIIYEIMMGKRPYLGKSRQEIKQKIKEKQIIIPKRDIPEGWSIEAADFTNKLLQRKPVERLGWAGMEEIKNHPWLRYFPWQDLMNGKLESPMKRFYNHAEVRYRPTENDTNYNRLLSKNK